MFMRERTDKSFPNSYTTAKGIQYCVHGLKEIHFNIIPCFCKLFLIAVMESIMAPVTKKILIDFIRDHRYKGDGDIMPPPRGPIAQPQPH